MPPPPTYRPMVSQTLFVVLHNYLANPEKVGRPRSQSLVCAAIISPYEGTLHSNEYLCNDDGLKQQCYQTKKQKMGGTESWSSTHFFLPPMQSVAVPAFGLISSLSALVPIAAQKSLDVRSGLDSVHELR